MLIPTKFPLSHKILICRKAEDNLMEKRAGKKRAGKLT